MANQHIAIIGAGIAGLSCATALQNAGFIVTIFEKSRGPSGRVSTRITPDWQCDHGAQYFTARDADFYAEVKRWIQAGVASLWQPKLQVTDGQVFTHKALATERFVGLPANTAPAKFLSTSLNVLTETTIEEIEYQTGYWRLKSKEHGLNTHQFDALVLAIPAPQAAKLLAKSAPSLAKIAESVVMRGCWALMCRFNHPLQLSYDGLFVNQSILSWVARDSAKPGRPSYQDSALETWVLHANSEWSEAHIEENPEIIAEHMINAFIKLGGKAPQAYTIHRWRYAECAEYLNVAYLWDDELQIGLCGDWLNGGKVQGAWLSGFNLAKKLKLALMN